jgi:hypothetical protein
MAGGLSVSGISVALAARKFHTKRARGSGIGFGQIRTLEPHDSARLVQSIEFRQMPSTRSLQQQFSVIRAYDSQSFEIGFESRLQNHRYARLNRVPVYLKAIASRFCKGRSNVAKH